MCSLNYQRSTRRNRVVKIKGLENQSLLQKLNSFVDYICSLGSDSSYTMSKVFTYNILYVNKPPYKSCMIRAGTSATYCIYTFSCTTQSELKTLEWDILNPDLLTYLEIKFMRKTSHI